MTRLDSNPLRVLLVAVLCVAAYAPAFNNGFIADDYHNLMIANEFASDPSYLLSVPPQNFRVTTFIMLAIGQWAFGEQAAYYYIFPLLIHFLNCLLLWKLMILLGRPIQEAFLAACIFSVFQAPQEAMMWLSASAEAMLAFTILAMVVLWLQDRYLLCALMYCIALVSKESAPVAVLLIPLIDWLRGKGGARREYLVFIPPTLVFGAVFLWLSSSNPMIQAGIYEFGPQAILVALKGLHRLMWPWMYILIIANRCIAGRWISPFNFAQAAVVLAAAMLPYVFLTYTDKLPSRHVYMASIIMMAFMAWIIIRTPNRRFRQAFVLLFILFNISYLWIRKDAQYEERAAPTTALLEILETVPPAPIMIVDFAYPYPIIAKAVSQFSEGWTLDLIRVEGVDPPCESCTHFRWNPDLRCYQKME